jgi:Family of unknown function (DUF6252)
MFLVPALALLTIVSSCKKDDDDDDPVTDLCALPNGSLKWTSNGQNLCANASLFADYAIVMTVNGISQQGATLTLELDSVNQGTYQMKELVNSILYTDVLGMAWQSTDDNPGTITITKNNTSTNEFEATFNVPVRNPLGMSQTLSGGTLKVFYTE